MLNTEQYLEEESLKTHRQSPYNINNYNRFLKTIETKNKRSVDIPTILHINIDVEINNIDDLLNLISKYKIDDHVKYNINMKSLHDIKDPLIELNNMIGMKKLKKNIVDQIIYFIQGLNKATTKITDFIETEWIVGDYMHTVIYGPPGTGKTEIAKILGKIFSKLGILKNGTFKKVTRSDLIAGYVGQTSLKTRTVINENLDGVLFIDEAYALGNNEKKDSFSKECIDTICEALSDHKDKLMVIIAGYEHELKECFFNYNQGLESRFTWRFETDAYTGEDLYNIFVKKVREIGWLIHENSGFDASWFVKNAELFKNYGRDIETFLAKTKIAHSRRVFCKDDSEKRKLVLLDLENGLESYLLNSDIQNKKEKDFFEKELQYSIYC
uniref:AAA+ ATPase domain-containing protein n=1 Tax=viral metagenome TaxID=1070528 RepID=A0A6C0DK54_9ZZZZ